MKCNDSQNHMMKFFDRELNDIEEAQLKLHLRICTNCSKEFVSLKEIFADIEQDSEIEPPEDFERQVMSRIETETKMYKKTTDQSAFVYNILLVAVSFIFVIFFGGILWESLRTPINAVQFCELIAGYLKDFLSSAISMGRGIIIAIVSVTASLYKTYYYAYIVLGILLLIIQRIFIKMVREGNGGAQ
ncbi:MAG: anti-sigma factor family protein [Ruminiclostridium sp.]